MIMGLIAPYMKMRANTGVRPYFLSFHPETISL
jgi:hypothetical protein